jgi:hypothetical protein
MLPDPQWHDSAQGDHSADKPTRSLPVATIVSGARAVACWTVTVGFLVLAALLGVAMVRVRTVRRPLAAASHDPSHA